MTISKRFLVAFVLFQTLQVYSTNINSVKYFSTSIITEYLYSNGIANDHYISQKDTLLKRENLNGDDVVPKITFPGITQADFKDAFNVLDECLVMEPRLGFKFPFIAPGGRYGACWWQLDASLALSGTKWANQHFSENVLRGFAEVQKSDGRIPLYGYDKVPDNPVCSSLPKLFSAAYAVLKQTNDKELIQTTYDCLKNYMGWWLSDFKRDEETGLITGVFEESLPAVEKRLKAVAQVDLNVEVAIGCNIMAKLARQLGITADYKKYTALEKEIKAGINKYMWDESKGAYYSYLITEKKLDDKLICYAFDPFRLNMAPQDRIPKMIKMLTDNKYFNWEDNAITSAAKTDITYNESVGVYNGAPAWSGDIWSLRNEAAIQGLEDIGRYDLASYLSLKTVKLFNANYSEFLKPSDGSGQGERRYAWSASQYIQILIEKIFGIDYDGFGKIITIRPNLNEALSGKDISLERLLLPDGNRLNLYITNRSGSTNIKYTITGENKEMNIIVALPTNKHVIYKVVNKQGGKLKPVRIKKESAIIYQISNGKKYSDEFTFISGNPK